MRIEPRQIIRAVVLAALLVVGWAPAVTAQSVDGVNEMLSAWQMDDAKQAIDAMAKKDASNPNVLYLQARHDFFLGDYEEAVGKLDQAISNGGENPAWVHLREVVEATGEVTKDYVKHTSPQGHFEIWVPEGKDEVLVPFAGEALDRAYEEIGDELGYKPATPIRVEVYPQTSVLAKVSSLTEDEIRTSGTIALCKYNRLMITSPKALLRGYGWVDTLVHEYVHYVINSKTQNRVPIWMHEGLAKYLERRWRGPDAQRLPPSTASLLEKRVKADDLITFEQMHPSMAKLPSQEDAAVAFAEVYTVMEYLREQVGEEAFESLLDAINDGHDAKEAFSRTVGKSFASFERDWLAYLKTRDMGDAPEKPGFDDKLVFKEEEQAENDLTELDKPQARDHMHLGEMLQARSRFGAAKVQYEKALRLVERTHPVLQTRLAQCLLEDGKSEEALDALESVRQTYPGYVQAWIEMGKASLALGDYEAARDHLSEAARINPFDPEIHQNLAKTYDKLGDKTQADTYRKFAKLVS
ncbi:MAG: tetratricopeptide repeat protein [Persicimonas sp.]